MRPAPRRWMLPAPRMSAESSASRQHALRGAIEASSARTSSERGMTLQGEQATLVLDAERAVGTQSAGRDDPVAGDDERKAVVRAERARCSLGIRVAGERRQLAVRDRLAVRNGAQDVGDGKLERR